MSPIIYSLCVCVCACLCVSVEPRLYIALASGCGPGKTKHWRRSSAGLTSCGPKQPQQPVITVCVCLCERRVCVFGWRVHLCRQVGIEHAESPRWDVKFWGLCLYERPCLPTYSVHTQTHIWVALMLFMCMCVCVEPEPVNYMGLAVGWKPGEVWFVVCHHGCLGMAKAPGEIRANSTIFSLFGRVALILSFIAGLAWAAKHRRRERSRVACGWKKSLTGCLLNPRIKQKRTEQQNEQLFFFSELKIHWIKLIVAWSRFIL